LYITHNKLLEDSTTFAPYVAIETDYDPYLAIDTNPGESHNEAGGYVFDRNKQVVRLFDPEIDLLPATYEPIKDDDGDYIFDVFEQVYRPFREWSTKEKRHPVTLEQDDTLGVYGDVVEHPIKFFDGHLGKWKEEPTRYRMSRIRKNPVGDEYKYLKKRTAYTEIGYYKDQAYQYTITYPAGY
jgi:hypothetical protein